MNHTLPKGTVIGDRKCPGCGSLQPIKVTKTGGNTFLLCGMCSTRLFFGPEPSQAMIAQHINRRRATGDDPAAPEAGPKTQQPAKSDWDMGIDI